MGDREIAEIEAVLRKHAPQTWISGQQFRRLNDDAIALIATELAALRSKDREDGARITIPEHAVGTLRYMLTRAGRMMRVAKLVGDQSSCALYREEIDALTRVFAALPLSTEQTEAGDA